MNNNFNFDGFNVEVARDTADGVEPQDERTEVSHDDGSLHVSFGGSRYWFYLGQELSHSAYNRDANRVLRNLGVVGTVTGNNN